MSKRFPKPEITLDGIYSKFADESFCKDFLLDIRFEKGANANVQIMSVDSSAFVNKTVCPSK